MIAGWPAHKNICKNLKLNKFYSYPCLDPYEAESMETADTTHRICGAFANVYKSFSNEQDMLIYNCVRNTSYQTADESYCKLI